MPCDGEGDRVRVRAGVGASVRVGLGSRDAGRAACREVRAAIVQLLKQEGGVAASKKAPLAVWPAATWVAVAVAVAVTVTVTVGGSSVHAAVWAGRLPSPLRLSSRNAESEAAAYGLSVHTR